MKRIGWMMTALTAGATTQAADLGSIGGAIGATRPIIDARLRYEGVDQEPMAENAEALTLRARLGFETGKAWETALLVEGEFVWPWVSDYNSTINGKTQYPVVADPESYEFNRVQLVNTSIPQTTVTLGRQRINLDDQRFVGNVGWRQNEQTFDALRVVNKSIANLTFDVTYLDQVNRVFSKDSPQGRYQGDSFLGNVSYQFPVGKLTAFGYWLEFDPIPNVAAAVRDSSQTYGLRFAGERPLSKLKLAYAASYATQEQYSDNPLDFDNDYTLLELTGTYRQYNIGLGWEVMEGNGVKGFTTPLATLHKFQGWADKFLATPVNGLADKYLTAGYTRKGVGPIETLGVTASWHDYTSDIASIDYGSELDVQLSAKYRRFTGTLKLADYSAAATTPAAVSDTRKLWVQIDYVW